MKLNSVLIILLILMNFSFAESQTVHINSKDTIQNSLKKGSLSLLFGIAANLNLQTFNNYSISAKYHFFFVR